MIPKDPCLTRSYYLHCSWNILPYYSCYKDPISLWWCVVFPKGLTHNVLAVTGPAFTAQQMRWEANGSWGTVFKFLEAGYWVFFFSPPTFTPGSVSGTVEVSQNKLTFLTELLVWIIFWLSLSWGAGVPLPDGKALSGLPAQTTGPVRAVWDSSEQPRTEARREQCGVRGPGLSLLLAS